MPGSNILLLRRTFPELKKGLIRHFELLVPPEIYGGFKNWNQSSMVVAFPNGSKLFFGSCQHEKDVMAYNGQEFLFIGIDEATEWTYGMFEFLSLQNRCPVKNWKDSKGLLHPVTPCMALATNPGGIGHAWIKALFIGEKVDGIYTRTKQNVWKHIDDLKDRDISFENYTFIPAKVFDNPAYKDDKHYLSILENANAAYKERYLYGSWETFEGAYFEKYDPAITTLDKLTARRIVHGQPWHPKWIGIDWGYQHWAAVYWFSQATLSSPDGSKRDVTLVYDELVEKKMGERDLAMKIVEKCYVNEKVTNIQAVYISPDAFAKRGSANTVAEQIGEVLAAHRLPYPSPADDDRVGGARLLDEMLSRRPDPDLMISDECSELLDAIPVLQVDPDNQEDVLKTELRSDDIYDGLRYGTKSMLASGKTPFAYERELMMSQCASNQERFWTDVALAHKKKAKAGGIRFQKPRFSQGSSRW